jgi:putative addiction module component (TIGR02574 family)
MDMATALKEIRAWPVEDRLELVEQVWDSIAESDWKPELTEELKAKLDQRLEALDKNPDDVLTWEDIVAYVRRKR